MVFAFDAWHCKLTKKLQCQMLLYYCWRKEFVLSFRLKFFKSGETEAVKFRGTRDLASLTAFINEQLGNVPQVKVMND